MRVVHERCCGLDVHKKTVTACVITPEGQESRAFGTMTKDLLQLGDWLIAKGVSHVAMESTAFYWKPVYNVLEGLGLELLVVNAYHIKTVPGRKTDVKDAEWIADLLRHGLLRGSYIPDRPQRELRELVRYRKGLVRQRVQVVNRIEKVLEGANIKLSAVATDIVGLSGRAMLEAMVAGEEDASTLAELARGRLRRKQGDLEEALRGAVGPHQRFLLASLLRHLSFLDEEVRHADEEVEDRMRPFEDVLQRLDTIPGVGRRAAEQVVAEIGLDMNRFPTAGHLASWARVCPGNNESAGKRLSGCTGRGNPWLRAVLVEAAWPAARSRNTYLSSQYHRLAARRGGKRAVLAVAHTILVIAYHLIKDGMTYRELGGNYFDEREREATVRRSVRRLHADVHSIIDPGLPIREIVRIHDHVHAPLAGEWSVGLEDGYVRAVDRAAAARAEDVRVLNFYGEGRSVDPRYTDPGYPDECQAWIVLEHAEGEQPNVSVVFHSPEGNIDRHWPTSQFVSNLVQGWNDSCYTGPEMDIEDALMDAGLIEEDGTSHALAVYRFTNDESQSFDHWFPGRPDVSTITTIAPYDQLFLLLDQPMTWTMDVVADPIGQKDTRVSLVQGWNSVCYAGPDNTPNGATSSIAGDFPIMYTVASDQSWRRHVPEYPWATNIITLSQYTSVSMPVTAPGGAIWEFEPLGASNSGNPASPEETVVPESNATPVQIPNAVETCAPVFPGTFLGTITVEGVPAADGTVVHASIGAIEWATAVTSGGLYVLDVPADLAAAPPCFSGGQVTFHANGLSCQEFPAWNSGLHELNLTCGGVATTVRIGSGQASPGTQVTVPLEALAVPPPGLGAFTVDVMYEPGVVTPVSFVDDPDDIFDSTLCNLGFAPNTVRCSGVRSTAGATGDLTLADLTFEVAPAAPLGHESPLTPAVPTFADPEGLPIPRSTQGGSIRIGLVGNVDCDDDVDAVDALFILQYVVGLRLGSDQCPLPLGTPGHLHLPSADADCDADVDAVDALFVLQHVVGLRPVLCPSGSSTPTLTSPSLGTSLCRG